MVTSYNPRVAEAEREKTSLELPAALNAAFYRKIDELLDELGESTSRPEFLSALMLRATRMSPDEINQLLREYRKTRVGDLGCGTEDEGSARPRRGRPRANGGRSAVG